MVLSVDYFKYAFEIIEANDAEIEQLESITTRTETKWVGKGKKHKFSTSYMLMYRWIPLGFYRSILALSQSGYHVDIKNFDQLTHLTIGTEDIDEWVVNQEFKYIKPRWYQTRALHLLLRYNLMRVEVATGGGKSFIIALYARYLLDNEAPSGSKILIITTRQQLVDQMIDDIYDYKKDDFCKFQAVYAGTEEVENANIIVGTYQSLCKWEVEKFKGVYAVICDESHSGVIDSIKDGILPKARKWGCRRFVGLSGTQPDRDTVNGLHLEAYMGPIGFTITAKPLMDEGSIAKLKISYVNLHYSKKLGNLYYNADEVLDGGPKRLKFEKDLLHSLDVRNDFLSSVCNRFVGNQVILVESVEYAKFLVQFLAETTNKETRLIYGGVKRKDRKEIIEEIKADGDNLILVATYETMSTGVSVNNIMAVHFPDGGKSEIRIRQSIGRGLRLHPKKDFLRVFDYCDIIPKPKYIAPDNLTDDEKAAEIKRHALRRKNLFHIHGRYRMEIYQEQGFEVKQIDVDLA